MTDLAAADAFLATHARLLERRRLDVLLGRADGAALLAALAAYRNADGGFGWGLEPDLRAPSSQPAGALEAFELLAEAEQASGALGAALCGWLERVALPGGGLPFALAGADAPGSAPWWAAADPAAPSLHVTAAVVGNAWHAAEHDADLAAHPWLARATDWCLEQIAARTAPASSYELAYVLALLDALDGRRAEAAGELARLAGLVPRGAELPVEGGAEGETLQLLAFAPRPGRPLRALLPAGAMERQLDALAAGQRRDGGWTVDFPSSSPAGALEWRGVATVRALRTLRLNGRV